MDNRKSRQMTVWVVVLLVLLAGAAYMLLTMPDNRTPSEKVGDAVKEMENGADKAARQLDSRTPAQKLEDTAKDAGDAIKESATP